MSKPTADELTVHFNMIELYPKGGYNDDGRHIS